MSKKIVVVCPKCNNNMEISIEQKNSRIECSACNDTFMAFEAVICNECGKFRHPNHRCKCCIPEDASTIEYFEKQNWYNPFSWGKLTRKTDVVKSDIADCDEQNESTNCKKAAVDNSAHINSVFNPLSWGRNTKTEVSDVSQNSTWYNPFSWGMTPELKEKIENEKKREQEIAEVFNRLPEDIKTVLEYETDKYEKLLTSMRDRIEELENTVSDLESEIENLKEKDE